ncbi:kelch-like protein 26 [Ctenocephalides felis]|uniref:kelch-like protein 26 n=1 Tax=Ctenocephalides felis TaxID=7515 RepID=UPI000E6E2D98|nr:kelch-like protein 26 [Ctenocephalides felis]
MTKAKDFSFLDKPLNTVYFDSPSHTGTLLSGLHELWKKGQLLDITLLAEGIAFKAHRAVLASCSDYFRAMFTDAMLEARQSEISLNGVTANGIKLLLDYAYTSRLALNLANIQDVLSAASHVQVDAVVEACSNYLQSQLDLENCVDIVTIAETYSLAQLRHKVYRFMSGHLQEFSGSSEFQCLSLQQLEHLLVCDFPVDCPEKEVLKIVLKWLRNRDPMEAQKYAQALLQRVHFSEIQRWELDSILKDQFIYGHAASKMPLTEQFLCRMVLAEAYRQTIPQVSTLTEEIKDIPLVNSRGMELAVIKVGGFGIGGITNEITYFLPSVGKWRHLTSIPHVEQCNFGTAVLDNKLFVVGGCFNQLLQENIHPFGFCYSPRSNKWTTMAPMQRERCRFSLNVASGRLYAIGGVSEMDDLENVDEEVSACESYDPVTDTWFSFRPLPQFRTQHAGASWPKSDASSIFISGGLERDMVLSSMVRYDIFEDIWENKASMLTPRADHVMLLIGNNLYVCGGWYEDTETGNRVLVDTIDLYDVSTNVWETITRVPTPRYHAGIVAVNTKIYFIGGFHSDVMFDRVTAAIECYDIESKQWTTADKYPQDIWEHTCVTLYIPRCRDDMEVMKDNQEQS